MTGGSLLSPVASMMAVSGKRSWSLAASENPPCPDIWTPHHFVESRLAVSRLCGLVTLPADPVDQELSNPTLVVDDQHQRHRTSRFSRAPLISTMIHVLTKPESVFRRA